MTRIPRNTWIVLLPGLVLSLPVSSRAAKQARDENTRWFEHSMGRAWLEYYDPTLVSRRAMGELSLEDAGEESLLKLENSVRWGFPIAKDLALALQAMLPLRWQDVGDGDAFGLGDLEARAGFVGRIAPSLRAALGANATFETATDRALGGGVFELRPMLVLRWDVTDSLNLGGNVEYNFTPADEGADEVSALELKFPVAFKISERWSGSLTYKPKWDCARDDVRHRMEVGATYVLGADREYAFGFGVEVPLASERFEYKILTGITYYFH